ncbi:DUF4998 domain-containing protein [Chitinophaga horti]|uniref:DUF4998 domain-containing protein n=1 Tax=Chitinophaga horti TaxID=2920382 RepID=A0ABY6IVD0_9BACT|nr:DUF4998 domain-containing protein [Chitinophaga horti]UYQ91183.1 DUF4998 domain-containing protein [Chitinophaga horti]
MKLKIVSALLLLLAVCACDKDADKYRDYLDGQEIVYPGLPNSLTAAPGNYRIQLSWKPGPDPSVMKYRVFWNNGKDSVEVSRGAHTTSDTIEVLVPNLTEYTYSFTIYAYDDKGHRSVPLSAANIKVFGNSYRASLTNRFIVAAKPYELVPEGIRLFFEDADTINTGTRIRYTGNDDATHYSVLKAEENTIVLEDYKSGTPVYYRSSYIPVANAIDTFSVAKGEDSITNILAPLDKSLFSIVRLPNDANPYGGDTDLDNLWDGSVGPQGYPNIWHSNGDRPLPHHFTFDMGRVYPGLALFEITGRDGYHNPVQFEVWGTDNLTNAVTTLPGNNPGWKAEAIAKGWKLLKEVTRPDNGIAPYKVEFDEGLPAVRYIRIRVVKVASNDNAYSNLSELTFWRK